MDAQQQNFCSHRFDWAHHMNDCEECGLHADAVKPLLHEVSSRTMAAGTRFDAYVIVGRVARICVFS